MDWDKMQIFRIEHNFNPRIYEMTSVPAESELHRDITCLSGNTMMIMAATTNAVTMIATTISAMFHEKREVRRERALRLSLIVFSCIIVPCRCGVPCRRASVRSDARSVRGPPVPPRGRSGRSGRAVRCPVRPHPARPARPVSLFVRTYRSNPRSAPPACVRPSSVPA